MAGGRTKARDNDGNLSTLFRLRPGVDKWEEKCEGNNFFNIFMGMCVYIYIFVNIIFFKAFFSP